MTSTQIRQSFLDFFKSKQHTIVPSSSLMPDSPNLLFTNAGMNQFVPIFLGEQKCPYTPGRAADTQKCIRAGGKHNDLEDVGLDTYHHTFFEMLGNWSFGDYFKKEAIEWAWELVTEVWKFPKERLYATVYKPAEGDPSEFDQEAYDHWARLFQTAGLDPNVHIVNGNKKDNFWMMGETGPCGPCSELHVDLTPAGDTRGSLVNKGDARCIEIWNLVFIQFNANPDGTFTPLPARHVDTGMGFERVTSILQCTNNFTSFDGIISNYETDIFRPLFDKLEMLSGRKYASTLPQVSGSATVPVASASVPLAESPEKETRAISPAVPPTETESPTQGTTYYKRRLPHFERPWAKYMVTFTTHERRQLSAGARDIVLKSLLFGHEQRRYQLYAACVMPDHVHFLLEPQIKERGEMEKLIFWPLDELLHSIKSFTAHEINKLEKTSGQLWEYESFDRMIRGDADLEEKFHYICRNPWDSGAVSMEENYPWLWTPEQGSATVPVASPRVSRDEERQRDADGGGRDARAPHSAEQIQIDVAFRVIADHIRTLSFAIADGIQPGNTDRNYVLRRILRRAVRYGRTLGFHQPFFYELVDVLVDTMGDVFPEIRARKKHVQEVIRIEEEAFNRTLDRGIEIFGQEVLLEQQHRANELDEHQRLQTQGQPGFDSDYLKRPMVSGETAFMLYDTYGFPLDLTELMARERGLTVDVEGFNKLMEEQRERARAAQKKQVIEVSDLGDHEPTRFVGYDELIAETTVTDVVDIKGQPAVIVDQSPFYAEMGGQVGDSGEISSGGGVWSVRTTQKAGHTWLHFLDQIGEDANDPDIGSLVTMTVDRARRSEIQRHHTVTHLLHWALHEVVSRDASQKGSFVGPDKLTFDFNSAPLSPQQVSDVEHLVNQRILENAGVSWVEVPYSEVRNRKDVMQFFGDKYGDTVRVVQIGGRPGQLDGYSMELCGGTHTLATGEIGLFRIVGESAIAAGVRRIEAIAGLESYRQAHGETQIIRKLAGKVNTPVTDLEKKIEALLEQQKALEKQLKAARQREASNAASELKAHSTNINGTPAIIHHLGEVDGEFLQSVADSLKGSFKGVIVLGGCAGGSVSLVAAVTPDFTSKVQAGNIIKQIAPIVGGRGGGRPDNARGGGKDAGKLDEALAKVRELIG